MTVRDILSLLRVKQWIKNLVIFLPIFFSGTLLFTPYLVKTAWAFIALSLLTSSVYIINDIVDRNRDSLHPNKRERVIVSGKITIPTAIILSLLSLILSVYVSSLFVQSEYFTAFMFIYLGLMLAYTVWLKHIGIVDAIIISMGFVLRVVAGAVLLEIPLSAMLVITIIGSAILISFGKRKAEISSMGWEESIKHRPALAIYPKGVLDVIIATVTSITFFAYIMYCYGYLTVGLRSLLIQYLPPRFQDPQWLLLTIPVAFYVLVRYLVIIYKGQIWVPEDIWIKDKGMFIALTLWIVLLFLLIYFEQFSRMF